MPPQGNILEAMMHIVRFPCLSSSEVRERRLPKQKIFDGFGAHDAVVLSFADLFVLPCFSSSHSLL